ncbi:hypothetical protein [Asticcacaulis sp.]|uniref:hypothetical protein n=1 Tax=Asticcacaulis sp. TaxID=1872648 RepID=UPI002BB346BF|nr:hypothetical protein [Asticcacaulis sp.]HTM79783.1 hypothetical protein [Asticcacaulis sp.]
MYVSESIKRGFNAKQSMIRYMRKTGRTLSGRLIWMPSETDIIEEFWPDWPAIEGRLPHRTAGAIKAKARAIGFKKHVQFWQPDEKKRMVPPYKAGEPISDIVVILGDRSKRQIYGKASHLKIRRPRKPPKPTGMRIVDLIRQRAFDLGYTMAELDFWVGRKKYFVAPKKLDTWAISGALKILGGSIVAVWVN